MMRNQAITTPPALTVFNQTIIVTKSGILPATKLKHVYPHEYLQLYGCI